MPKSLIRVLQGVAALAIIALATRTVVRDWDRVRSESIGWGFDWWCIVASLVVTWLMYLLLIHAWRAVLLTWGEVLPWWRAVRIWFVSSLGKYIPGKLWALAAMAVMAERAGVSGAAATASSVVMQLVSITTGIAVAMALLGREVLSDSTTLGLAGIVGLAAAALAGTALVGSPYVMEWLGKAIGRPGAVRHVGSRAMLHATLPSLIAWLGYGTALFLLVRGTLPGVQLGWGTATGAFAASYIAGYLAVFAPGGLGVREGTLILILGPVVGQGNAIAIAFASRLTLTINELGAALPLLVFGRSTRDLA
ncbi:MAG: flippase-like domain-containing protein [Gemmatimonadales bacterium]|nr:flippase-like domain-containing protein [Gemmatimonadales bacterium]